MFMKVDYISENELPPKLKETIGEYPNRLSKGWREITADAYFLNLKAGPALSYRVIAYNQFLYDPDGKPLKQSIDCYWYGCSDGTGVAMVDERLPGFDKRVPRFYAFGCAHKWREMKPEECRQRDITHHGMCWHVYECEHCGAIEAHDSSD